MTFSQALRLLRANLTQRKFVLRARREDWNVYTSIMLVDDRRAIHRSTRDESKPIPHIFKGVYDPYAHVNYRWKFVTSWVPDEEDLKMDWDVWTL